MGLTEEGGKVATATVSAMSSQPLAIALLVVNIGFLGFAGFVLGKVAANAQERNQTQMSLIGRLADDLTNCRAGPHPTSWTETLDYAPSNLDAPQQ